MLGEHLCPLLPFHQSGPNLASESEPVVCFPSLNFSLIHKYCCSCRRKAADKPQTRQSFESWGLLYAPSLYAFWPYMACKSEPVVWPYQILPLLLYAVASVGQDISYIRYHKI